MLRGAESSGIEEFLGLFGDQVTHAGGGRGTLAARYVGRATTARVLFGLCSSLIRKSRRAAGKKNSVLPVPHAERALPIQRSMNAIYCSL